MAEGEGSSRRRPTDEPATASRAEQGPDVTEVDDRADGKVPWRVFGGIGAFIAVLGAIYWWTSYEHAGSVMLTVAAVLGLWAGAFLWRAARRIEVAPPGTSGPEQGTTYLPDASPWPIGIGLGLTLVLNGLLIGTWFLVPGVMVLAVSVLGWAHQSRHRA